MLGQVLLSLIVASVLVSFIVARPSPKSQWVIIFDAGSTSTKTKLFNFQQNANSDDWDLKEIYEAEKWRAPLAGFDPEKDKQVIKQKFKEIFNFAKEKIKSGFPTTPVFLYATAGLRAIKKTKAERLLDIVRESIRESEFDKDLQSLNMTRVTIIQGTMEGYLAWRSLNYIVNKAGTSNKFIALDMGGGSTQIALESTQQKLKKAKIPDDAVFWLSPQNSKGVYSVSFKDLGFSMAILKYLGAYDDCVKKRSCSAEAYKSKCLNPQFKSEFEHGLSSIKVTGEALGANENRYDVCLKVGESLLETPRAKSKLENIKRLLSETNSRPVLAINGFYFLAVTMNSHVPLTKNDNATDFTRCKGFTLSFDQFVKGAQAICKNVAKSGKFEPYDCIRATFTSALLQKYQLHSYSKFVMCKNVYGKRLTPEQNIKTGWTLGAAEMAVSTMDEANSNG